MRSFSPGAVATIALWKSVAAMPVPKFGTQLVT